MDLLILSVMIPVVFGYVFLFIWPIGVFTYVTGHALVDRIRYRAFIRRQKASAAQQSTVILLSAPLPMRLEAYYDGDHQLYSDGIVQLSAPFQNIQEDPMLSLNDNMNFSLEKNVTNELDWDPQVTADQITVSAKDGIVTLRGSVPHYLEKATAERCALRVAGVLAVANEIVVELMGNYERTDADIARAGLEALQWNYSVPDDIKIVVQDGWVTLRGECTWDYQREAAVSAISSLMGVVGVSNYLEIAQQTAPNGIRSRIEDALARLASHRKGEIHVTVSGDHVTLSGHAHSHEDILRAGVAAWNAPGVRAVDNNLTLGVQ